jgi:N-acetylglucosaminyldiphosphoundecaprenol N-acetyl-beta-D-mannosaminyltransferase
MSLYESLSRARGRAQAERGARPTRRGSRRLLGVRVDVSDYLEAAHAILAMADAGGGMTCVATVHTLMEAWDDPAFRALVNDAELVTSDGMPLVWSLRALGAPHASRVYGPTLMPFVCEHAARRRVPVGFYGGSPKVMDELTQRLVRRYPRLAIAFTHCPPYSDAPPAVDEEIAARSRSRACACCSSGSAARSRSAGWPPIASTSRARWSASARRSTSSRGEATGPAWIQRAGLEWLFRLAASRAGCGTAMPGTTRASRVRMALQLARERARRLALVSQERAQEFREAPVIGLEVELLGDDAASALDQLRGVDAPVGDRLDRVGECLGVGGRHQDPAVLDQLGNRGDRGGDQGIPARIASISTTG